MRTLVFKTLIWLSSCSYFSFLLLLFFSSSSSSSYLILLFFFFFFFLSSYILLLLLLIFFSSYLLFFLFFFSSYYLLLFFFFFLSSYLILLIFFFLLLLLLLLYCYVPFSLAWASLIIGAHSSPSNAFVLHRFTPSFLKWSSTSFIHLSLGRPLSLLPSNFPSNIFLTDLVSLILINWTILTKIN